MLKVIRNLIIFHTSCDPGCSGSEDRRAAGACPRINPDWLDCRYRSIEKLLLC